MRTAQEILEITARENGITVADIVGRKTDKNDRYSNQWLTLVRMQAARRLRGNRMSLPQIGRILGRDHTMALYYLRGGGKSLA